LFVRATDEADFIPLHGWFLLFCSSPRHDNRTIAEIMRTLKCSHAKIRKFPSKFRR
jgi:hypothetical protein